MEEQFTTNSDLFQMGAVGISSKHSMQEPRFYSSYSPSGRADSKAQLALIVKRSQSNTDSGLWFLDLASRGARRKNRNERLYIMSNSFHE